MPVYRDLWENIRKDMPKKGRGAGGELDPLKLPTRLQTALEALYGHYEKTFKLWEQSGIKVELSLESKSTAHPSRSFIGISTAGGIAFVIYHSLRSNPR